MTEWTELRRGEGEDDEQVRRRVRGDDVVVVVVVWCGVDCQVVV